MSTVRAVVFDYGHTLVDFTLAEEALRTTYEQVRVLLQAEAQHELPDAAELVQQVSGRVFEAVTRSYQQRELEELDVVALFQQALGALGLDLPVEMVQEVAEMEHRAGTAGLTLSPANLHVLEDLRRRDLRIGIVSNAHFLGHMMRADLDRLGIAPLVDDAVFSSEIGLRKPHPAIYEKVLTALDVPPEQTVFVGDRLYDDIRGAQALGMRGVLTHEFRQEVVDPSVAEPAAVIGRLPELLPLLDGWLAQ